MARRLAAGGRWIRISGTAAQKPWISAAFKTDRSRHCPPIDPINYPTVPGGTERLRLTPTPLHSDEQIDRLVTALAEIWRNSPVDSHRAGRSPASNEGGMFHPLTTPARHGHGMLVGTCDGS